MKGIKREYIVDKTLKIAMMGDGFHRWNGGIDFFIKLLKGLENYKKLHSDIEVYVNGVKKDGVDKESFVVIDNKNNKVIIKKIYDEFLERPLSDISHSLLHTTYQNRSKLLEEESFNIDNNNERRENKMK